MGKKWTNNDMGENIRNNISRIMIILYCRHAELWELTGEFSLQRRSAVAWSEQTDEEIRRRMEIITY